MSYILDALKKSEQKRRQGKIPDLPPPTPGGPGSKPRRSLWLALLVIVLIINGALLGWWLLRTPSSGEDGLRIVAVPKSVPKNIKKEPSQQPSSSNKQAVLPPPPLRKKVDLPPPPVKKKAETEPLVRSIPPADTAPDHPAEMPRASDSIKATENAAPEPSRPVTATPFPEPRTEEPVHSPSAASTTKTRGKAETKKEIYDLDELPATVRRLIPEMVVTLHFYTPEAAARMVRVNGLNLHEGNAVNRDVRVDQITPEGIIFSSSGYRFQIPDLSVGR